MNKTTKNTILYVQIQKSKSQFLLYSTVISQQINQDFETILFCFHSVSNDKTFSQRSFLPSKIEIVSMYFPIEI